MSLPPPAERVRIDTELGRMSLEQVKAELALGRWSGEKREYAELYAERREREKYERLTAPDRNIQKWILALAAGTLVATLLTWFLL